MYVCMYVCRRWYDPRSKITSRGERLLNQIQEIVLIFRRIRFPKRAGNVAWNIKSADAKQLLIAAL